MDNTAEFEDLVQKLDTFEQEAKSLQEKIARLMHDAREVSGVPSGPDGAAEGFSEGGES